MKSSTEQLSKTRQINLVYSAFGQAICLVLLYVILLFALPVGHETIGSRDFNPMEYKVMRFAVSIPSMLVWLAAFTGYSTLRRYAQLVKDTPEGTDYDRLATGCAWLAWSLPISSLVSLLTSSLSYEWGSFQGASIIITNYVTLVLPLIAFTIISGASRRMLSGAELQFRLSSARLITFFFLLAGVLYCYFTFSHFHSLSLTSARNPYYLPIWLMVLTVTIPYLYVWFVGLLASYEITVYSKQIAGVLYRRALRLMVSGLVTIIVSSIALQYLNGIEPRTGHLLLDYRLLITVLFRITSGIGFIALSVGALRLKKIEEV